MASTEAYIITSTILSLYFIAKKQFLHGELNSIFTSATLLVCSVTVRVLHILLSQDNLLDLLILHMSGVCKTQAFTLLLK